MQNFDHRHETITGTAFLNLWRHLGGGEIRGRRAIAFWRGGKRDSVAIDIERGLWHDHATGDGGDAVALVRTANGLDVAGALRWLEQTGYRQPSRRMTAAEIAEHRRKREEAERRRLAVADFRRALDGELDRLKLAAGDAGDDAALEAAASLQYRLMQSAEGVFSEMLERDGGRVAWLVAKGREERQDAAKVAAVIVDMLAAAQCEEGKYDRAA